MQDRERTRCKRIVVICQASGEDLGPTMVRADQRWLSPAISGTPHFEVRDQRLIIGRMRQSGDGYGLRRIGTPAKLATPRREARSTHRQGGDRVQSGCGPAWNGEQTVSDPKIDHEIRTVSHTHTPGPLVTALTNARGTSVTGTGDSEKLERWPAWSSRFA